jgi:Holliday junction resolvasome RuvABC ATP-dependent DNA helicase subunit
MPTPEQNRANLNSPECPLSEFIGNEDAVELIKAVSFFSWNNHNHAIVDKSSGRSEKINLALLGGAGLGKTTLAKAFAKTVELPFAELHKVTKVQEIFDAANKELIPLGTPIAIREDGKYKVPPMIWFADEVHRYVGKSRRSPSGIMNDLLKATEPDDATLTNGKWVLDCSNVCWVVATTEWHLLPSPFRSRFMEVKLFPYTEDNVTEIVKARFPDMDEDVCRLAAQHGCLVPRQALNFAKLFRFEKGYKSLTWMEAAKNVAEKKGIDEWGMTSERRDILTLLGKYESLSKDKLVLFSGQPEIELDETILPPLVNPAKGEPLIQHGGRGWSLLPAGVEELEKRGIPCTVHVDAA